MIICIIGKTGTGKTTIARELSRELNIPLLISHTSRPMRKDESIFDYHFVNDDYFETHKKEFVDIREYTVADGSKWRYGISKESIEKRKDYITIVDAIGFENLSKHYYTQAIILESDNDIILERLDKRGDDKKEIERRLKDDEIKIDKFLENIPIDKRKIVFNNGDIHSAIDSCINAIRNFRLYRKTKFELKFINILIAICILAIALVAIF